MVTNNKSFTKDKVISYEQRLFIKSSLKKIGINAKNKGLSIFQKAIIYVYTNDIILINLEELYKEISKKTNISPAGIKSSLRYSFENLTTKKLSSNYEDIFGIELDYDNFNIKSLISDFIDVLEDME